MLMTLGNHCYHHFTYLSTHQGEKETLQYHPRHHYHQSDLMALLLSCYHCEEIPERQVGML